MDAGKTGALIAQARKEKGMLQRELAEALHVSAQAVSKWERGLNFPDISLLEPLAEALGLNVTELMAGQRGELPQEDLVRDSLRIGLAQLRPKIRRWRGLFLGACTLLLLLVAGMVWLWVRDNTQLLPQRETTLTPLETTEWERQLFQSVGGSNTFCYPFDVALADDFTGCSFQAELWTCQGMEQSWSIGSMDLGDMPRPPRHQLLVLTYSPDWPRNEGETGGLRVGIHFMGAAWRGPLEDIPFLSRGIGVFSLEERANVQREDGVILLALSLDGRDGGVYVPNFSSPGQMTELPEYEGAAFLLVKLYVR